MSECLWALLDYEGVGLSEEQVEIYKKSGHHYMVFSMFGQNSPNSLSVGPSKDLKNEAIRYAAPKYKYVQLLDVLSTPLDDCINSNIKYIEEWNASFKDNNEENSYLLYGDYYIKINSRLTRIYCPSFNYKNYIKKHNDIDNLFIKLNPTIKLIETKSLLEFTLLNSTNHLVLHNPSPLYVRPYKDQIDINPIRAKYAKLYL